MKTFQANGIWYSDKKDAILIENLISNQLIDDINQIEVDDMPKDFWVPWLYIDEKFEEA